MKHLVAVGLISVCVVVAACDGNSEGSQPKTKDARTSTRAANDQQAAEVFIAAWSRGDSDGMRQLADDHVVNVALAFGKAQGSPECSEQTSGQFQCIVEVSAGKRAYILVGEPGDRPERVWWAAEYHPHS